MCIGKFQENKVRHLKFKVRAYKVRKNFSKQVEQSLKMEITEKTQIRF